MFKKILALGLIAVGFFVHTYAYTSADVNNANYLANKGVIKDWSNDPSKYSFDDSIARVDVIAMALAMKGITKNDTCRGDFSDVSMSHPYYDWVCRTVETAADHDLINAQREIPAGMRVTRPYSKITRSEVLAIFLHAFPRNDSPVGYSYYWNNNFPVDGSTTGYRTAYYFGAQWQAAVFYIYIRKVLQDDTQLNIDPRVSASATR